LVEDFLCEYTAEPQPSSTRSIQTQSLLIASDSQPENPKNTTIRTKIIIGKLAKVNGKQKKKVENHITI
jgi:lipopolysaccharide biosynthesis regulator YciM